MTDYLEQARRKMDADIVSVTRKPIGGALVTGRCPHNSVAELLHLHSRTYQRRLKKRWTMGSPLSFRRKSCAMGNDV